MGWISYSRERVFRNDGKLQSVGNAAYIHGREGYEALNRQHFDYTDRHDVLHSTMTVPENAPEWVKEYAQDDKYVEFWNDLEQRENDYLENRWHRQGADGILQKQAKTFTYFREIIALPKELNQEQAIKTLRYFAKYKETGNNYWRKSKYPT